jgi:hypothetical protein
MQIQNQVGPIATTNSLAAGQVIPSRAGNLGDTIISELHGRFYEQAYRGNLFSAGLTTLTSISNATFTVANGASGTLATAATGTPILGIWNPSISTINAVILQATLGIVVTALTATGAGGFAWVAYAGNTGISTGTATLYNRKNLTASGSQCKNVSGVALTGLTNVGVVIPSVLNGGPIYNVSEVATAAGFHTLAQSCTENFDGSIILPPGGLLGLYSTTTPVALSAISSLLWEEVPL